MPFAEDTIRTFEFLATGLATDLAKHLGVECGRATFEGLAFAGTCAPFYARTIDQPCPPALAQHDSGEWTTEAGEDVTEAGEDVTRA